MKNISELRDKKIKAKNILLEMNVTEYVKLIKTSPGILERNEYQRRRVRSSNTVYKLLKDDFLVGCVIPPIVLALTSQDNNFSIDDVIGSDIEKILEKNDSLVILDGLQRTYTILDLLESRDDLFDSQKIKEFKESTLRIELYIGLDRIGILYRMLTLNTGQTPMSLRQQIEMLYSHYITENIDGIDLIKESDEQKIENENQYVFKDVVEGFNSYVERDASPLDKGSILENIKSLKNLSEENSSTDIFKCYVNLLHKCTLQFRTLCKDVELSAIFIEEHPNPFGKNILKVFKKSQVFSGFGAALGKLIHMKIIDKMEDLNSIIDSIEIKNPEEFLESLNKNLEYIKDKSPKIGTAQRVYFTFFFRDLFNEESDSYLKAEDSADSALRKYQSQYLL